MPNGQQMPDKQNRKNFGNRDPKSAGSYQHSTNANSCDMNYGKKDDSKRKITAKRSSKNTISNRVIDDNTHLVERLPKLDNEIKKERNPNSSVISIQLNLFR